MKAVSTPLDDPRHPVGSMRWTYIPTVDDWERCEVVAAYSQDDMSVGRHYSELYDVRRPNGIISCGHFPTALRDMRRHHE